MKYIDTNMLVRVITGDDPGLAAEAMRTIQQAAQNEISILDAILVEVCFVLEFHDYKMVRADIADALQALFSTPQIFVSDLTRRAVEFYKSHPALDYADCLLFVMGGKNGVLTFDKDLQAILVEA